MLFRARAQQMGGARAIRKGRRGAARRSRQCYRHILMTTSAPLVLPCVHQLRDNRFATLCAGG